MDFAGKAIRLEDVDLPALANPLGLGEDALHALIDVECRGRGFDSQGRPSMLFEPHVFYRRLKGKRREKAVERGCAYKKWGSRKYPACSYHILEKAMLIDEDAALSSSSWGLGQVMGFNCELAGFGSAKRMVKVFCKSERRQLEGMLRFIASSGLLRALQDRDWGTFALGYNGPSAKSHGYHTRLEKAFEKWSNIPDTPYIQQVKTENGEEE